MNDFFFSIVKNGFYDLVLIMTCADEFIQSVLDEARRRTTTVAWNCDDDWRWDGYSAKWAKHYTWMVTTYRHVLDANRAQFPNLVLSQWGCTGFCDGVQVKKDIGISFVGGAYGKRFEYIERLRKTLGIVALGKGISDLGDSERINRACIKGKVKRFVASTFRIPMAGRDTELQTQSDVKNVWNRSRISFTPLEASRGGGLQIKARVFDMGLSGTLMLCNRNEALHEFYEPGKEYVEFDDLEDCVEKARFYLNHEAERERLAEAYYRRTQREHLWQCRFEKLFKQVGLTP